MKSKEANEIITDEGLYNINWYNESSLKENQVVITKNNGEWVVYVTDERATIVPASISRLSSEDEALDILIQKARYAKKYLL